MKKLYQNPKFLQVLLTIWLVLLYLPSLNIAELPTANGTIPVSFCYLFSLAFFPFLLFQLPKLRIPPWYVTGLYLFVILWALVQVPAHGLSKSILHWVFGAFLLLVLVNMKEYLTGDQVANVLQTGILVFFVCHLVYNVINWHTLYEVVFQGVRASALGSVTRGGRNLDATWLGLGCLLVRNKKLRIGCLLYSLAYAVVGVSRAGIIASGLCMLWILIYDDQFGFRKKTAPFWCGIAVVGLAAAFGLGLAQRMIERMFSGQGEGAVSFLSGREYLWENVGPMFKAYPFGVGVGNAVPVLREQFGFASYEDVMHNVFFQLLLDEGFLGGLWFLGLAIFFVVKQCRQGRWFRQPLAAYLLGYLILSLVQFHGGEALMIFAMGCFLLEQEKDYQIRWLWRKKAEAEQVKAS